MTFEQFGLLPSLTLALEKLKLTVPTPVQLQAISIVQAGSDTYINAETGSGKTLAYLLPLYQVLNVERSATQVLIIVPTHELALQIHRVSCDLAQHAGMAVRNVLLIGGTASDRQIEKLKKKPQIIIGTPGRVLELIERGKIKLSDLKTLVIDEADRLLAEDSLEMVQKIVRACPGRRQLVFVSATEQPKSKQYMEQLSPNLVRLHSEELIINHNIDHFYMVVEERDKPDTLRKLIHATKTEKVIVFVHRNETAEDVAAKLEHHKIIVADLHSTTHVFNLDLPSKGKDYLHRVGRCGRAGARGVAVSILIKPEVRLIELFEQTLGIQMRQVTLREGQMIEISEARV